MNKLIFIISLVSICFGKDYITLEGYVDSLDSDMYYYDLRVNDLVIMSGFNDTSICIITDSTFVVKSNNGQEYHFNVNKIVDNRSKK